jgi:hypothetical protein
MYHNAKWFYSFRRSSSDKSRWNGSLSIWVVFSSSGSGYYSIETSSFFFLFSSWGLERSMTGGWSLLAMMSDWQHGVDWLLAEYCRCRLRLDLRWCKWRADAKGLFLPWPPGSGETSRPDSRDPVASGVKCEPHSDKKSKTKSSIGAGAG